MTDLDLVNNVSIPVFKYPPTDKERYIESEFKLSEQSWQFIVGYFVK
jgi:hypothetical protein